MRRTWVPGGIAAAALAMVAPWLLQGFFAHEGLQLYFDILQAIVTTAAIGAGGLWAFYQFQLFRASYPHLTVSQTVTHRRVNGDYIHIAVVAIFHNTSRVKVELREVQFQLLEIAPIDSETAVKLRDQVFESEEKIDIQWPLRYERSRTWPENYCIVEPRETLEVPCEFIVPVAMKAVLIFTYAHNAQYLQNPNRVRGWPTTTVHDIAPV